MFILFYHNTYNFDTFIKDNVKYEFLVDIPDQYKDEKKNILNNKQLCICINCFTHLIIVGPTLRTF